MEERVRVLVADDQDLVRSGFKLILMSYDGIDVVGEARDGHEAVELASRLHPDVDEYVYDALAAGASGFLLKDAEPDEIASAVRVVAQGDALIEPSITRRLIETFVAARPASLGGAAAVAAGLRTLTDREREILALVARGFTNDEIGSELFISPATVKTHLARIMAKLDAHDRAQLVVRAYEGGLVRPGIR